MLFRSVASKAVFCNRRKAGVLLCIWQPRCRGIADKLGYDELLALKGALERQAERVFPVETQLRYGGGRENDGVRDGAFLI